jgi:hypothetical protein
MLAAKANVLIDGQSMLESSDMIPQYPAEVKLDTGLREMECNRTWRRLDILYTNNQQTEDNAILVSLRLYNPDTYPVAEWARLRKKNIALFEHTILRYGCNPYLQWPIHSSCQSMGQRTLRISWLNSAVVSFPV